MRAPTLHLGRAFVSSLMYSSRSGAGSAPSYDVQEKGDAEQNRSSVFELIQFNLQSTLFKTIRIRRCGCTSAVS